MANIKRFTVKKTGYILSYETLIESLYEMALNKECLKGDMERGIFTTKKAAMDAAIDIDEGEPKKVKVAASIQMEELTGKQGMKKVSMQKIGYVFEDDPLNGTLENMELTKEDLHDRIDSWIIPSKARAIEDDGITNPSPKKVKITATVSVEKI